MKAASCTSSRRPRGVISNSTDDDLVLFIVGGKGGYVERDGQLVSARRPRSSGMA